jgi:hypothetical protein
MAAKALENESCFMYKGPQSSRIVSIDENGLPKHIGGFLPEDPIAANKKLEKAFQDCPTLIYQRRTLCIRRFPLEVRKGVGYFLDPSFF